MKRNFKRYLALMLASLMCMAVLPVFALGAEKTNEINEGGVYYLEYGEPSEFGLVNTKIVDKYGNELEFSSDKPRFNLASVVDLPSSYNLADYGRITAAKNQGEYGTCWAHSAVAVAESDMITDGYVDKNIDYSEDHLVNFSTSVSPSGDGRDNMTGDILTVYESGFDIATAFDVIASWSGLELEENAPYTTGLNAGYSESQRYSSYAHLQGWNYLAIENEEVFANMNTIKQHIMEEGAVTALYYADKRAYGSSGAAKYSHYIGKPHDINHAVVIIGWDDNYSVDNFNSSNKPPEKGAWLLKNSWGTSGSYTDSQGYFWISYYDATISHVLSCDVEPADNYDNIYQHSNYTGRSYYYNGTKSVTAANVFTANGNEVLEAASFRMWKDNYNYEIKVYTDVVDGNPESGNLRSTTTGSKELNGYHTVKLSKPVNLVKGQKYSIVLTLKKTDSYAATMLFEGDDRLTYSNVDYIYDRFSSNPGESYLKSTSGEWLDTSKTTFDGEKLNNALIKAFTSDVTEVDAQVEASKATVALEEGDKETVKVTYTVNCYPTDTQLERIYESKDDTVVKCSILSGNNGTYPFELTGLKPGATTVEFYIRDKNTKEIYAYDSVAVTVSEKTKPDIKVEASKTAVTVEEGSKETINVSYIVNSRPAGAELKYLYNQGDAEIVKCNPLSGSGGTFPVELTGLKPGTTTVKFYIKDKNSDEIYAYENVTVTVTKKAVEKVDADVKVSSKNVTVKKGGSETVDVQFTINSRPDDLDIYWVLTTADKTIVSIEASDLDDNGVCELTLNGVSTGTTTVRAMLCDESEKIIYASEEITVTVTADTSGSSMVDMSFFEWILYIVFFGWLWM